MKERPILFSGEMVRAILDGRKTETRRVVLPQPMPALNGKYKPSDPVLCSDGIWRFMCGAVSYDHNDVRCPFGLVGDRLWVREAFAGPAHIGDGDQGVVGFGIEYRADGAFRPYGDCACEGSCSGVRIVHPWKPSIHMPRWASRISLEVTGVRVEQVQQISASGVRGEGRVPLVGEDARQHWEHFWNLLNAKRGYGWDVNPWVWVIEFRRVEEQRAEA
jgi:hypothetical protein